MLDVTPQGAKELYSTRAIQHTAMHMASSQMQPCMYVASIYGICLARCAVHVDAMLGLQGAL